MTARAHATRDRCCDDRPGEDGEFSFEPGGAYRTNVKGENRAAGRFLELDPPKRVVFTWGWETGDMPVPPDSTTVEITL
nr:MULTISPECIES: SRPBCC domain-containing protein [unclassified Streptomyces]